MDFGVTFEIVLANETFFAVRTLKLSISKMGLNMRFDVLFPSKALLAIRVEANPFSIERIGSRNERRNIINCNSGFSNRFVGIDARN